MVTRLEISSFLDMLVSPRDKMNPRFSLLAKENKPTQGGRAKKKQRGLVRAVILVKLLDQWLQI